MSRGGYTGVLLTFFAGATGCCMPDVGGAACSECLLLVAFCGGDVATCRAHVSSNTCWLPGCPVCAESIDMWGCGCVFGELLQRVAWIGKATTPQLQVRVKRSWCPCMSWLAHLVQVHASMCIPELFVLAPASMPSALCNCRLRLCLPSTASHKRQPAVSASTAPATASPAASWQRCLRSSGRPAGAASRVWRTLRGGATCARSPAGACGRTYMPVHSNTLRRCAAVRYVASTQGQCACDWFQGSGQQT